MAVHVGLLTIVIEFEGARSLKDKRRSLRSLLDRARRELHVSVAEVGFQNRIRTGEVAFAFVGTGRAAIERARDAAERFFASDPRAVPVEARWEWL